MSQEELEQKVEQLLQELRDQVSQRRSKLEPESGARDTGYDLSLAELRTLSQEIYDNWNVSAHLPVMWNTPVIGRLVSYAKRGMRILLRWYINPIVEQQNNFNEAVARAIVQLTAYEDRLRREWQLTDERLDRLEELLSERSASGVTGKD
ncbi:MAG: hypothetical protein M1319_01295 [Chloroflexi bacterium]|nr:hypothetical protein [Chloroflexota bacterium]